jgi:hypothetical protein
MAKQLPITRNATGTFQRRPLTPENGRERTLAQMGDGGYEEASKRNYVHLPYWYWPAAGGSWDNPMGFPGYHDGYYGNPPTYRWMLQHHTVRYARAVRTSQVAANSWEYAKKTRFATEEMVNAVKRIFDRLRPSLIDNFYRRGCDYGWQGGELIWLISEGQYELDRVKPLLVDVTTVLQDRNGNFTGLRNYRTDLYGADKAVDVPAPFKAWKFTYDGEAGYHYGRSWLENLRATSWKEYLDAAQQLQRLGAKITGIITIIQSPSGTYPGPDGSQVSYQDSCIQLITDLAMGAAGGWLPTINVSPNEKGQINILEYIKQTAGKSLTTIDVKDFSGNAAAIGPILERMRNAEAGMFQGALRSARVGLEAKHGAKEEATVHTDTGTINAEEEDEMFARACQPLVDAVLMANWGDRAKGAIEIAPPSLIDRKEQTMRAILMALFQEPAVRIEGAQSLDVDKIMSTLQIPTKVPFDGARLVKEQQAAAKAQQQQKTQQANKETHESRR